MPDFVQLKFLDNTVQKCHNLMTLEEEEKKKMGEKHPRKTAGDRFLFVCLNPISVSIEDTVAY